MMDDKFLIRLGAESGADPARLPTPCGRFDEPRIMQKDDDELDDDGLFDDEEDEELDEFDDDVDDDLDDDDLDDDLDDDDDDDVF